MVGSVRKALALGVALMSSATAHAGTTAPAPKPVDEPQKTSPTTPKPLEQKQFGAAITETKSTPLTELIKEPAKFNGQTVRTEGVVTAVCKSRGCWMEIGDENGTAHIKMAGHSFFVPKTASGHRAVIQGRLLASEEEAGHTCKSADGCREAHEQESGRLAKVEMEATGVEFLD